MSFLRSCSCRKCVTWWCWLWACTRSRSLARSLSLFMQTCTHPSLPLSLCANMYSLSLFVQTCTHIPGVGGRSHYRFLHRIRLVRLAVRARFLLLGQHLAQRQELVALRRYDWARAYARVCAQAICTQRAGPDSLVPQASSCSSSSVHRRCCRVKATHPRHARATCRCKACLSVTRRARGGSCSRILTWRQGRVRW